MKKLMLVMTQTQKSWIESRAKKLGISQTEVVRRLIDTEMEKGRK